MATHLPSNAVKYSPGNGPVDVVPTERAQHVELSVRDCGLGIPAQELPGLFGRFFRASTCAGIAGTGLVLHIVRPFVELHGGLVRADSAQGRGSVFTVKLPIAPSSSRVPALPVPS